MSAHQAWQRRLVVGAGVAVALAALVAPWWTGSRASTLASGFASGFASAVVAAFARGERPASEPVPLVAAPGEPIAAEALVFQRARRTFAAETSADRRRPAHPRTLATFRALRAYPGAPPRIPHGLTADEYRATRCRTCHEQGGFSQRFGAYAPVTPHPERAACLQCHVADAALVGVALPASRSDALCGQCHTSPPGRAASRLSSGWRPAAWPRVSERTALAAPAPPIPHELGMRGNCLACHAGPGAVAGLVTTHPQRADCAGCHVLAVGAVAAFARPAAGTTPDTGRRP